MEVENSSNENNLLEQNINYFKILYPNQNYRISLEYQKWKKSIEEKIGKNKIGKEILCKKDNIIIYNEDINNNINCPLCKTNLYLCKYCNKIQNRKTKRCCFRAHINEIIIEKKAIYKYINIQNNIKEFYLILGIFFVPFCFLSHIILISMFLFYLNLENEEGERYDSFIDKKACIYTLPYGIIIIGFILSMLIAFSILFYILFLSILIISLPFKLYSIKIVIAFFYSIL